MHGHWVFGVWASSSHFRHEAGYSQGHVLGGVKLLCGQGSRLISTGAGKAQLQGQCAARDACVPETGYFGLTKDRTGGRKFCFVVQVVFVAKLGMCEVRAVFIGFW